MCFKTKKSLLYFQILSLLLVALIRIFAITYVFISTLTNDQGTVEQRNQGKSVFI
jgi:hypothetical protein